MHSPKKSRPNRQSVDPCIPSKNVDRFSGPRTVKHEFSDDPVIDRPRISNLEKILKNLNPRDFTWSERMTHNLSFDPNDSSNFHQNHIYIMIEHH